MSPGMSETDPNLEVEHAPILPTLALTRYFVLPKEVAVREDAAELRSKRFRAVRMGDLDVLLDASEPMELLESPALYPVPNAPTQCQGLINIRGGLVPVFDIRSWLRLKAGETPPQSGITTPGETMARGDTRYVLVLGKGGFAAGLVIDVMQGVLEFSPEQALSARPVLPERVAPHCLNTFRQDERPLFEIDCLALLRQQVLGTSL